MKYGVIDLGSNTVRLSIYEMKQDQLILLYSLKEVIGLASFVNDDGYLSNQGILKAIDVVNDFKDAASKFENLKLYCIATAAIRNAKNSLDIIKQIEKDTNVKVILLTGVEEAVAGVMGIREDFKIIDGLVVDIGGGSTEVSLIENEVIKHSVSLPMGSLNTYMNHVKELLPSDEEMIQINNAFKDVLIKSNFPINKHPRIYGMGGTLNAIKKLIRALINETVSPIQVEDLKRLLKKLDTNNKSTYLDLIRYTPERIHTLIPGLVIILTMMSIFDVKELNVSKRGIREGFIRSKIIIE